MIGRITGLLAKKAAPQVLIDVNGVGYEIDVPMSTLYQLPPEGQSVTLVTHLAIKEDAHTLYGFASATERAAFRELLKVSGIGPPDVLQAHPELTPWCSVQELQTDNEQLWLMQQYPSLLPQLNLQSPLMQWMVAARKDSLDSEVIERMPKSAALKHTLQMAKKRPLRSGGRV